MEQKTILLLRKAAQIGEFLLYGNLYRIDGEPRLVWQVNSRRRGGNTNYLVIGDEFHAVSVYQLHPPDGESHIVDNGIIQGVPVDEQEAILTAVKQWNEEYLRGDLEPVA